MKAEELKEIKDCIAVVTGVYNVHVCNALISDGLISIVNFDNYDAEKHGILMNPEGFTKMCCDNSCISNHPVELVKNCERLVKSGYKGIIITNSHFVLDAIDLYTRKYKKNVRFFFTMSKDEIKEYTNKELKHIYKSFAEAIDILDDVREEVDDEDE